MHIHEWYQSSIHTCTTGQAGQEQDMQILHRAAPAGSWIWAQDLLAVRRATPLIPIQKSESQDVNVKYSSCNLGWDSWTSYLWYGEVIMVDLTQWGNTVNANYKTFTSRCFQPAEHSSEDVCHPLSHMTNTLKHQTDHITDRQDHLMFISKAWIQSCSIFMSGRCSR